MTQIITIDETNRIDFAEGRYVPTFFDGSFWCAYPTGNARISKSFKKEEQARQFIDEQKAARQ